MADLTVASLSLSLSLSVCVCVCVSTFQTTHKHPQKPPRPISFINLFIINLIPFSLTLTLPKRANQITRGQLASKCTAYSRKCGTASKRDTKPNHLHVRKHHPITSPWKKEKQSIPKQHRQQAKNSTSPPPSSSPAPARDDGGSSNASQSPRPCSAAG
jgi:hypothetical protein